MCVYVRSVDVKQQGSKAWHSRNHALVQRCLILFPRTHRHSEQQIMSGIGPELPPHILAKRKRKLEEDVKNDHASVSGAKRSSSPEGSEKRRRVVGPALPPAPIDQRPPHSSVPPSESESDDGDGFGPALPAQKVITYCRSIQLLLAKSLTGLRNWREHI